MYVCIYIIYNIICVYDIIYLILLYYYKQYQQAGVWNIIKGKILITILLSISFHYFIII